LSNPLFIIIALQRTIAGNANAAVIEFALHTALLTAQYVVGLFFRISSSVYLTPNPPGKQGIQRGITNIIIITEKLKENSASLAAGVKP